MQSLANEEVRQRDFNQKKVTAEAEPDVLDDNADDKADPKIKADEPAASAAKPLEEARTRLDALTNVPDSEPLFLAGNWEGVRLMLYRELLDFDAIEKISV